jgi:diguanylate cyclase (GGDEF)-like protein
MKTVEQVMSADVVTIGATRTAADAIALTLERDISVLPVVDDNGRVLGLITMRDLLRALPYRPAVEVMRQDIQMITPQMPLTEAYALLDRQRTGQLPVVADGRIIGLITIEDVLRALGLPTDPLTELPWSAALRARAVDLLKRGFEIAIIFIDLDNFGLINKQHGHVMGDRYIQAVAQALQAIADPSRELLCRYGGDEFAILTTRHRDDAEALGRSAVHVIEKLSVPGAPEGIALAASMGIAGGKRTTERHDIHYEATVDDLITLASRQTTQAKVQKAGGVTAGAGLQVRLRLRRVTLSTEGGQAHAVVELSLRDEQFIGESRTPNIGAAPWRALAESTVTAVNQALPEGWIASVDDVGIVRAFSQMLATVTVHLGQPEASSKSYAGCVIVEDDIGQAVVKATLQALNWRLGRLLAGRGAR